MNLYEVIRRPLVTEKGVLKKDTERTLCFEVHSGANKTQVKSAPRLSWASCGAGASFRATGRTGRRPT